MRRVVLMAVVTALSLLVPVAPVAAQESAAVAVNRQDGKSVFKLSFSVKRVMDGDVDAANAAVAYASCNDCRTVAASIQVVLAMDEVDSVTTENVAIAVNYQCSSCETLASAYQYVYGNGEQVRFTPEGRQRLADIRRRLHELRQRDDLTLEQLAGEIATLAGEAADVVDTELVPTGSAGAPGRQEAVDESTTTTSVAGSSGENPTTTSPAQDEAGGPTSTTTTEATPGPDDDATTTSTETTSKPSTSTTDGTSTTTTPS